MPNHCLVITHLNLSGLSEKIQGTYNRFHMLLQAANIAGLPLRIFCTADSGTTAEEAQSLSVLVSDELARVWRIEADIIISVNQKPSTKPWILLQLQAVINYALTPACGITFGESAKALLECELRKKPCCVIAHRLPAMFALSRLAKRNQLPPVLFDLDDVEHVMAIEMAKRDSGFRNKVLGMLAVPALVLAERRAIRSATKTLVCSGVDVQRLQRIVRSAVIEVAPNTIVLPPQGSDISDAKVLLMVGIYSYEPNGDAADYFISEIWPLIREEEPDAELWLVGKSPESISAYRQQPAGVKFWGFVPDVATSYRAACVVICPIRFGSGTRVKLVEAAAWGKPIVSTSIGAEGLGMSDGVDVLLADTPVAFAQKCVKLLRDQSVCRLLGQSARKLAESRFEKGVVLQNLSRSIAALKLGGEK